MKIARSIGLMLVALGVAATAVGLALPWTMAGAQRPDPGTILGIALLGPLLSLLRLAYGRFERRGWAWTAVAAAVGAVGATVVAAGVARLIDPFAGIATGAPLTIVSCAVTAAGWVAIAVAGPGALVAGRPWLAVVAVVAAVAVFASVTMRWYSEARFVDHAAVSASTDRPPALPVALSQRWQQIRPGTAVIGAVGAEILVRDVNGVRAYDVRTGEPAWHYLRTDLTLVAVGIAGDAVVSAFATADGTLVTAHEVATGAERFTRRYPGRSWHPTRVVGTADPHRVILGGTGPDPGDVRALDPLTGDVKWTYRPERDGGACDVTGAVAAGKLLALAQRCRATGVRDEVTTLSIVDGKAAWTWRPDYTGSVERGLEVTIRAAGTDFIALYGTEPRRVTYLDAGSGSGESHTSAGTLVGVAGSAVLYGAVLGNGGTFTVYDAKVAVSTWTVRVPYLAGQQLADAVADDKRAYLLLRGKAEAGRPEPLRVVAISIENGLITADVPVQCAAGCSDATVTAGPSALVVASRPTKDGGLALVALS